MSWIICEDGMAIHVKEIIRFFQNETDDEIWLETSLFQHLVRRGPYATYYTVQIAAEFLEADVAGKVSVINFCERMTKPENVPKTDEFENWLLSTS